MKKRYIVFIVIIILVLAIFSFSFIVDLNKETEIAKENIEEIKESYNIFTKNVEKYNQVRNDIIDIINNFYYDKIEENNSYNLNIINDYKNVLDEITKNVILIDSKCIQIYQDKAVNNICNNYQRDYEMIVNLYVNDVNNYNNKISLYNNKYEKKLDSFEKGYDYIDYNKDKVYEMVEDVNEKEN